MSVGIEIWKYVSVVTFCRRQRWVRKGNNRVVSQLYHWQTFQLTIFAISVDKMLQEVSPKPSKEPATSININ